MLMFIVGMFVGIFIGIFIMGLLQINREDRGGDLT